MPSRTNATKKLTYDDYVQFPEDLRRHEIIDGKHIVTPAPGTYHQTVSRRIQFQLYTQIELREVGAVYNAPTDLQLSETDIVQPDLIIILKQNQTIITPVKIEGTPDLVVEILSSSSTANDRVLKKELYRRSGIPEYWVVDPDAHIVEQFVLRGDSYALLGGRAGEIMPEVIEGVRVNLKEVW
ncbi:MAG: Uma2 family endonuclease [Planctomycetota bacterium]